MTIKIVAKQLTKEPDFAEEVKYYSESVCFYTSQFFSDLDHKGSVDNVNCALPDSHHRVLSFLYKKGNKKSVVVYEIKEIQL